MTIKASTVLVDRLEHALDKQGVKMKRRALLETAAYAFAYSSSNAFTAASAKGDIDPPRVKVIGRLELPDGQILVVVNDPLAGAAYGIDESFVEKVVGEDRREAIGITPYGHLVRIDQVSDVEMDDLGTSTPSEDLSSIVTMIHAAKSRIDGYTAQESALDRTGQAEVDTVGQAEIALTRAFDAADFGNRRQTIHELRNADELLALVRNDDAEQHVLWTRQTIEEALKAIAVIRTNSVPQEGAALKPFLMAALEQIDQEIDNRKGGGDPEAWADMQKVSDRGHAAARNIQAVLPLEDDADSIRVSRADLRLVLGAAQAHSEDVNSGLEDGMYDEADNQDIGAIDDAIGSIGARLEMPFMQKSAPKAAPEAGTITVHVARIVHKHGSDTKVALNEADLEAQVAKYCRETWNEVSDQKGVPSDPAGMTDHEIATTYYSAMGDMESQDHLDEETFDIPFDRAMQADDAVIPVRPTGWFTDAERIAAELEEGASSDIWYDAHEHGSDQAEDPDKIAENSIERTQKAMLEAAGILRYLKPVLMTDGSMIVDGRIRSKTAIAERAARDARDDLRYITYRNGETGDATLTMVASLELPYVNGRGDGIPISDREHEWLAFGGTLNKNGDHPVSLGASALWHGRKWMVAEIEFPFADQGDDSRDDAAALRSAHLHMKHIAPFVEAMGGLMELDEDATEFGHELAVLIPFEFAMTSCSIDDWHKALAYALSTEQEKDAGVTVSAEYTAQMQLGKGVYSTEPLGDTVWDATFDALRWGRKHAEDVLEGDATLQDEYAHSPMAPEWVRERSQFHPFEVEPINLDELYGIG